jgi:hypothetical protein
MFDETRTILVAQLTTARAHYEGARCGQVGRLMLPVHACCCTKIEFVVSRGIPRGLKATWWEHLLVIEFASAWQQAFLTDLTFADKRVV